MSESKTHKFLKQKLALALKKQSFQVETEKKTDMGRIDVYGKKGNNEIKIEVFKTHLPQYLVTKVKGNIIKSKIKIKKRNKNKGKIPVLININPKIYFKFKAFCIRNGYFPLNVICKLLEQSMEKKLGRKNSY